MAFVIQEKVVRDGPDEWKVEVGKYRNQSAAEDAARFRIKQGRPGPWRVYDLSTQKAVGLVRP